MPVQLVPADMSADIPALVAMDLNSFDPPDLFEEEEWEFYKYTFQYFWMENGGQRVGAVHLGLHMDAWTTDEDVPPARPDSLYLASIGVSREFQGMGIGSSAMESVLKFARENGFQRIASLCRKSNERSIRFHQKFGFRITDEIPELWEDPVEPGIIFELPL